MPYTVQDARDLLISSVLCPDPVLYIDDRWLYDQKDELTKVVETNLINQKPKVTKRGEDITIVGAGYSAFLATQASMMVDALGVSAEVVDVRILNPLDLEVILMSVQKTGRLLVVDGGWSNCGFAGEIIASVCERINLSGFKCTPKRITLPDAPAPCSAPLEKIYYPDASLIMETANSMCN